MENSNIKNYDLEVGLLKKDVEITNNIIKQLTTNLEKLEENINQLTRIITLHEEKLDRSEKREHEVREDIKDLHERISSTNVEFYSHISRIERTLAEKLDGFREDFNKLKINEAPKVLDIIKEIDKYKWMFFGAATAIGWILGNVNLQVLGTLVK